jgi:hypothetical protein
MARLAFLPLAAFLAFFPLPRAPVVDPAAFAPVPAAVEAVPVLSGAAGTEAKLAAAPVPAPAAPFFPPPVVVVPLVAAAAGAEAEPAPAPVPAPAAPFFPPPVVLVPLVAGAAGAEAAAGAWTDGDPAPAKDWPFVTLSMLPRMLTALRLPGKAEFGAALTMAAQASGRMAVRRVAPAPITRAATAI